MKYSVKKIILISIFASLSCLFYLFLKCPIPFFVFWLRFDFSMTPILLCNMTFGIFESSLILIIRLLFKLIQGSKTFFIGEIGDFIIGFFTCLIYYIVYKKSKNNFLSFFYIILFWIISSCIANYFVLIPLYMKFFNFTLEKMSTFLYFKNVSANKFYIYYIFLNVIPFNLLISISNSIVCIILKKRLINYII